MSRRVLRSAGRTVALAALLADHVVPAAAAPVVAGAYVRVAESTREGLDTLRGVGLNTLFVTSHTWDPNEVRGIGRLAADAGMQVIWSVYYDGGSESERGFRGNARRLVLVDGRRTDRTPCPLDRVYWQRVAAEPAMALARLSREVPSVAGMAIDVELYAADAGWFGPCHGDECWHEFWRARGKRVPGIAADRRAQWLARRGLAGPFEAFQHRRVEAICADIRRGAQRINPRFRFAVLPYQDFFADDLVRGFGTPQVPMYSMNEFTYGRRGLSPKELGIMMGLAERGLPCVPLAGFVPSLQNPELTRTFAYQAGQPFDGYWLYEGLPWRDVLVERDSANPHEAELPGAPADWRAAIRAANHALAASRGAAAYRTGWQPPSLLGYWTGRYWRSPGVAPPKPGPPIPGGRVFEIGQPLADATTFVPEGLLPGRYRVSLYVRERTRPALSLAIGEVRGRRTGAVRVGPEVWRVSFGPRDVPSGRMKWTVSGDAEGRLLYLACGAIFPEEWSVAGPYDDPGQSLDAAFPPDHADFHSWRTVAADRTGLLDLARLFGKKSDALAYAALEVWSPSERDAYLLVGSDDGVRVALNGEIVHENPTARHASPDEDVVAVRLRRGWNRVLAKVVNVGDDWGLYLRVYDEGRPLRYRRAL